MIGGGLYIISSHPSGKCATVPENAYRAEMKRIMAMPPSKPHPENVPLILSSVGKDFERVGVN